MSALGTGCVACAKENCGINARSPATSRSVRFCMRECYSRARLNQRILLFPPLPVLRGSHLPMGGGRDGVRVLLRDDFKSLEGSRRSQAFSLGTLTPPAVKLSPCLISASPSSALAQSPSPTTSP